MKPGTINSVPTNPGQIDSDLKPNSTPRKRRRSSVDLQMESHEAGYETNDESGNSFTSDWRHYGSTQCSYEIGI